MSGKKIKLKNNDEVRPPELRGKRKSSANSAKAHSDEHEKKSAQSSAKAHSDEHAKNSAQGSAKAHSDEHAKNSTQGSAKAHGDDHAKKPAQSSIKAHNGEHEKKPVQSSAKAHGSEHEKSSHKTESEKKLEKQKNAILRQTRKREKSLQAFNISVLVAIFGFISLFLILGKRPTKDEDERRDLAAMPEFTWESYFDGSFTGGVSAFFNDAVPGRSTFKNFIALFRTSLGVEYDGGVQFIGPPPVIEDDDTSSSSSTSSSTASGQTTTNSSSSQATQSTVKTSSTSEKVDPPEPADGDGDMSGSVFVVNGRGFSLFGGNKAGGQDYAETVNKFKERLGDSVNVYSMVIPTSGSYYLPKKYQNMMASERDNIDHINSFLNGVTPIDAYSVLAQHTDEYIYFRTDHHWTQLGAYYAAEEFTKVAGVPFAPLSEYDVTVREGMLGSLYGYSNNSVYLKNNPDTFTFYKPKNEFTALAYNPNYQNPYKMPLILSDAYFSVNNSYMVYGGDMQINHVTTDCDNGRRLVIIGDSYDNAMFLNLTNSFSEIWVVDMRAHMKTPYFNLNIIDFIQKNEATDLLFAMDTFSAVGSNRNGLKTMLENPNTLPEQ